MKKIIFTQEQLNDIINKYQNQHLSLKSIGEEYNVSRSTITRLLKQNNVEIKKTNHKYYANYRIFESIDSCEKAYWLGFIAADGCNYEREQNASITINIHQKDLEHLEKFKNFVNSNKPIEKYIQTHGFSNNTPMCRFTLNSKDMSKDLSDKGIVPRKSLILEPPKIDSKYYLPFILGYFDGDGSIFKTTQDLYGISIVGTKELLEWINEILNMSDKLEKRKDDDKNNFYIRCGGIEKPYLIMKKLYDSVEVRLDRKYSIFKELETVVLNRNIK